MRLFALNVNASATTLKASFGGLTRAFLSRKEETARHCLTRRELVHDGKGNELRQERKKEIKKKESRRTLGKSMLSTLISFNTKTLGSLHLHINELFYR